HKPRVFGDEFLCAPDGTLNDRWRRALTGSLSKSVSHNQGQRRSMMVEASSALVANPVSPRARSDSISVASPLDLADEGIAQNPSDGLPRERRSKPPCGQSRSSAPRRLRHINRRGATLAPP